MERPRIRRGTMKIPSRNVLILFVKNFLKNGGLSMPSITTSSWLSASEPPPAPPGKKNLATSPIRA